MNPIEAWRLTKGLSKYRIERRTGLSHQTVYNVFANGSGSIETLERIADCFGIELWELFRGPVDPAVEPSRDSAGQGRDEPRVSDLDASEVDEIVKVAEDAEITERMRHAVHARMTQRDLAKKLGTLEANVSRWLTGRHEPSLSMFRQICVVLGISSDMVLGLQSADVPIFSLEAYMRGERSPIDSMTLPKDARRFVHSDAELVGVRDASMTVVVDVTATEPEPGMTMLVEVDGSPVVARIFGSGDTLLIAPIVGAPDPRVLPDDARCLGQVVARLEDLVLDAMRPGASRL